MIMLIDINYAAGILEMTEDEVMFQHQSGLLPAHIEEDSMKWQFDMDDVLSLKRKLDEENERQRQLLTEADPEE
jgi:hypothetical protein